MDFLGVIPVFREEIVCYNGKRQNREIRRRTDMRRELLELLEPVTEE